MFRSVGSFVFGMLLFAVMAAATPTFAQSGWKIKRETENGDLISVFFTSEDRGWVAGDNGYLAYTDDGGRSWNRKELNTEATINEIYFRNDSNGYLVAGRKMFVTKDGGKSWADTLIVNPGEIEDGTPEFLSIRFNSKNQGFIIGSVLNDANNVVDSLLLKTMDGGETWSRFLLPEVKTELFHLDFDGKDKGWIVGDVGVILATRNNGTTWELQESGTTAALFNVDFRDDKNGFAVGERGTILRTDDGGTSWAMVEAFVQKDRTKLFRINFVDDKNGWIVGLAGTILRTYDSGKTWVKQPSATVKDLYGLYMDKKYGWSVGMGGIIIRYDK